jgi:hypothetical protein
VEDNVHAVQPHTPLASVNARIAAFVAILIGGALGGVIGYSTTNKLCSGSCTVPNGLGMIVGTTVAALGVAVIATLALRASTEWPDDQPHAAPNRSRRNDSA